AHGVVDTGARELADVVEKAGQQQDVGPIDTSQVRLRLGHRLQQVPVNGVSMDGIVLRSSADRLPGRDPSAYASGKVKRLPDRHKVRPGGQHVQQRTSAYLRPRPRQRLPLLTEILGR